MFLKTKSLMTHAAISGAPGAFPLVLLHSLGTDLRVWEPQAAVLSRSFRVIRPDLRGHGLSEETPGPYTLAQIADDVLALLDALNIHAAHIGGLSLGGLVAQAIAHAAPERVKSLVLCDTALALPPADFWHQRAATVRKQGTAAIADQVVARWVTEGHIDAPDARGLRAMLMRSPVEGYAASVEAIAAADFTGRAPARRIPTLVLVGEQDVVTPVAKAEALREVYEGELAVIANAAHIPNYEQADAMTDALIRFLAPPVHDFYEAGMVVRKQVLGEEHVTATSAAITELDRDFQAFLTRTAWGGVWARPGLDRRTRSLLTVAMLATLGCTEELELHLRATKNTGASASDVAEVLQQVGVYAGIPAANRAMRIAKKALAKEST
ncbi:MAG TPA: 4-carboxymuconolactone decarboxylase [Polyangiaceae bacterium]|nr:4-carboxymuconolactone decarboxylase [Polyangiaceae bacterium]